MNTINSGRSRFIAWLQSNLNLRNSIFDDGNNGSSILTIDDNNNVKSFQSNRPDFANTLTVLESSKGYLISRKSFISLPTNTLGFGSINPQSQTTKNLVGMNLYFLNDWNARVFANVARQARDFRATDTNVSSNAQPFYQASSATITVNNATPGLYLISYRAGGTDTLTVSAGTLTTIKKDTVTADSIYNLQLNSTQATLTLNITGSTHFFVEGTTVISDVKVVKIVPINANGYPNQDCNLILWHNNSNPGERRGTYSISYKGTADVVNRGNGSLSTKSYDAVTNTSSYTLSVTGSDDYSEIGFRNLGGVFLDELRIMAPTFPGSTISYAPSTTWDTHFLNKASKYNGLRYLDWTVTNSNTQRTWSERTLPTFLQQSASADAVGEAPKGISWELLADFSNQCRLLNPNFKSIWVNVPALADDNYITQMITTLNNILNPDIEVRVEVSNEIWNSNPFFQQFHHFRRQAPLDALTPQGAVLRFDGNSDQYVLMYRRLAWMSVKTADIIKTIVGNARYGSKWFVALCWQQGFPQGNGERALEFLQNGLDRLDLMNGFVFGGSAYYNPENSDPSLTLDSLFQSNTMNVANWANNTLLDQSYVAAFSLPTGKLQWDCYEGGVSFDDAVGVTAAQADALRAIKMQANNDPRMKTTVIDHHNFRSQYGQNFIFYYAFNGQGENYYSWNHVTNLHTSTANDPPKVQALYELMETNRSAVTQPLRQVTASTFLNMDGGRYSLRFGGFSSPADGSLTLNPGNTASYTFRVTEAGKHSFWLVTGVEGRWDCWLGATKLATNQLVTTNNEINFSYNTVLNPGVYSIRFRNKENFNMSITRIKVANVEPVTNNPTPPPTGDVTLPTRRAYFIGNSVTDAANNNGIVQLVSSKGGTHIWGRHMIPGAPLSWIREHPADGISESPYGLYPNALANHQWDFISLQPFDRPILDGTTENDSASISFFIAQSATRSPNARIFLYQRWRRRDANDPTAANYNSQWSATHVPGTFNYEMRDFYNRLLVKARQDTPGREIYLVPVGDVFNELNTKMRAGQVPGYNNIYDWYTDNIHINSIASYAVSLTYLSTMYRVNPVGFNVTPIYGSIPNAVRDVIQTTVRDAVLAMPYSGVSSF